MNKPAKFDPKRNKNSAREKIRIARRNKGKRRMALAYGQAA